LSIEDDKYLAIILQHEIDHLNGILFIDHLSPLKRGMYKKRMKKQISKSEERA
jgi:peptide deformylase